MKISYAIPVCDELVEIKRLIGFLKEYKRDEDEIVVLFDETNGTDEVFEYLQSEYKHISYHTDYFLDDFSVWKNTLNMLCTGDFIFQIDADEIPSEQLVKHLHEVLKMNPEVEAYAVSRVNTVLGLTDEHIKKWGWKVNEKGWVNFPDQQWRIYKNKNEIKWEKKVHETLKGYEHFSIIIGNEAEDFCLFHPKEIKRQERQNDYYDKI